MKKLLMIIGPVVLGGSLAAQQRLQVSQYMVNPYLVNPAFAGMYDYKDIQLGYRNQWVGIPDAPKTFFLTGHMAFGKKTEDGTAKLKHGAGVVVGSDKFGPSSFNSLSVAYSVHLPLTDKVYFAAGVQPGLLNYSIDTEELTLPEKQNDALVQAGSVNLMKPDMNAGLSLYGKGFFLGFSGSQLFRNKLEGVSTGKALERHYQLLGGFEIRAGERLMVTPSALVKTVKGAPASFDVNLNAVYNQLLWAGVSYRHQDAVAMLLGVKINNLVNVSYSYDVTLNALNLQSRGSHEIVLGFTIGKKAVAATAAKVKAAKESAEEEE